MKKHLLAIILTLALAICKHMTAQKKSILFTVYQRVQRFCN